MAFLLAAGRNPVSAGIPQSQGTIIEIAAASPGHARDGV